MRLTGAQGCPWGVWFAVSTGADFAGPGIFIADTVLPLRFPRLSIARPFDMLRSRIGLPCWRGIIQKVRSERALRVHVPGLCAARAVARPKPGSAAGGTTDVLPPGHRIQDEAPRLGARTVFSDTWVTAPIAAPLQVEWDHVERGTRRPHANGANAAAGALADGSPKARPPRSMMAAFNARGGRWLPAGVRRDRRAERPRRPAASRMPAASPSGRDGVTAACGSDRPSRRSRGARPPRRWAGSPPPPRCPSAPARSAGARRSRR